LAKIAGNFFSLLCVLAVVLGMGALAHADKTTGTWTGVVETRGNYYWERSTRVVAPSLRAELSAPNGLRLSADYLIDTITSASVGSGLVSDVRFTEVRHDLALGVGYEFDLGSTQLLMNARARTSDEPDYNSYSGSLTGALSFNDRSSIFTLNASYLHDEVGKILRGAARVGSDGRNLSDRGQVGVLNVLALSAEFTQILTPTLFVDVGYDLGLLNGFQANPYRTVSVGGVMRPENHPDARTRHSLYGRLAWYFRPTHTALHLMYRAYVDSWDIAALTPEVRLYQEIAQNATLRLRYRHYAQTRAYFQHPPTQYLTQEEFVTVDPKMTEFHSDLIGGQLLLRLDFLEDSAFHFAREASIDFSFDYIWNTNRYGNGVIAQVGVRLPF
jgi:hypothetical protein